MGEWAIFGGVGVIALWSILTTSFCARKCNFVYHIKQEYRIRLFENRVLSVFGPEVEKVRGGWRKELHDLCYYSNISYVLVT